MALNAQTNDGRWEWSDDGDDAAPITSRSPSFVRMKEADDRRPSDPSELVTESQPKLIAAEPARGDESMVRARCEEHAVDLEVRALQLAESLATLEEPHVRDAVRCLLGDVEEVETLLRTARLDASLPIVQHVYEWLANVVAQADARIAAVKRGEAPLESIGLSVAEYSSLFVRAIILPMIDGAAEEREAAHDLEAATTLCRLRELVVFTNWTLRRIVPAPLLQ